MLEMQKEMQSNQTKFHNQNTWFFNNSVKEIQSEW
jgi:hypothetical protein